MAPVSAKKIPGKKGKTAMKSYGRQGDGKTIKSLSLDQGLVAAADAEAKARGVSFSQYINDLLASAQRPKSKKQERKEE